MYCQALSCVCLLSSLIGRVVAPKVCEFLLSLLFKLVGLGIWARLGWSRCLSSLGKYWKLASSNLCQTIVYIRVIEHCVANLDKYPLFSHHQLLSYRRLHRRRAETIDENLLWSYSAVLPSVIVMSARIHTAVPVHFGTTTSRCRPHEACKPVLLWGVLRFRDLLPLWIQCAHDQGFRVDRLLALCWWSVSFSQPRHTFVYRLVCVTGGAICLVGLPLQVSVFVAEHARTMSCSTGTAHNRLDVEHRCEALLL